jgi:hypothetical protein
MGWIVKLLLFLVLACVAIASIIWIRRAKKRRDLEARMEAWGSNCKKIDVNETVFVLITTAADNPSTDLLPTIDSLFREAYCPQRVTVGIVTSNGTSDKQLLLFPNGETDRESYPYASRFAHQVRLTGAPSNMGAAAAREVGLRTLLFHEQFLLLVHAHTTFMAGWEHQFILEHAGAPKRVLTHRGEFDGFSQFTCIQDIDGDGMPMIGSRRFRMPPAAASPTLFASSRALFGLSRELSKPGLLGDAGIRYAAPHVDDFTLTLCLRLQDFKLLSPIGTTLTHTARSNTKRTRPWLQRFGVSQVQALMVVMFAEDAIQKILDKQTHSTATKLQLLQSQEVIPWVKVAFGRVCVGPNLHRALDFVYRNATNDDTLETMEAFRTYAARSVATRAFINHANIREKVQQGLMSSIREFHPNFRRPGSAEWEKIVGNTLDINSESLQNTVDHAIVPISQVLDTLGMDPRDGSVRWQGALGVSKGSVPDTHELRERFGSRTAFELERSRWQ